MCRGYFLPIALLVLAVSACAALGSKPEAEYIREYPFYDATIPKFSTPVTRQEIRLAYYRYSVVAIVRALHENDESNWNMILDKVAMGDTDWIYYMNSYIAPGTDAGDTTAVIAALACGLPHNPKAILGLEKIGLGISVYSVCSAPFYSPSYEFLQNYGERTLSALLQVDEPNLLEARDNCMRYLQGILDYSNKRQRQGVWTPE